MVSTSLLFILSHFALIATAQELQDEEPLRVSRARCCNYTNSLFILYQSADVLLRLSEANYTDALNEFNSLFVYIGADWCGYCAELSPHFLKAAMSLKLADVPVRAARFIQIMRFYAMC
jgi:hypothetical protein